MTIGQRRGLQVGGSAPRYVLKVLPAERTVVVGEAEALRVMSLEIEDLRRLAPIGEREVVRAEVQIRHRGRAEPATIEIDGARARVRFAAPVGAGAPGQAAVIYAGARVIAGGWIAEGA